MSLAGPKARPNGVVDGSLVDNPEPGTAISRGDGVEVSVTALVVRVSRIALLRVNTLGFKGGRGRVEPSGKAKLGWRSLQKAAWEFISDRTANRHR